MAGLCSQTTVEQVCITYTRARVTARPRRTIAVMDEEARTPGQRAARRRHRRRVFGVFVFIAVAVAVVAAAYFTLSGSDDASNDAAVDAGLVSTTTTTVPP